MKIRVPASRRVLEAGSAAMSGRLVAGEAKLETLQAGLLAMVLEDAKEQAEAWRGEAEEWAGRGARVVGAVGGSGATEPAQTCNSIGVIDRISGGLPSLWLSFGAILLWLALLAGLLLALRP
jgi:hypothetical protein